MACNVTSLMLYAIDALAEDEVVTFAKHVTHCSRCSKRLKDPNELRAAILESTQPNFFEPRDADLAELHEQRARIERQIQALEAGEGTGPRRRIRPATQRSIRKQSTKATRTGLHPELCTKN